LSNKDKSFKNKLRLGRMRLFRILLRKEQREGERERRFVVSAGRGRGAKDSNRYLGKLIYQGQGRPEPTAGLIRYEVWLDGAVRSASATDGGPL
jgi:hypothetical protein